VLFLGLLWRRNARPGAGASQEELQRQVIRLLDDVEGAAAEDSEPRSVLMSWGSGRPINLTIQNLREIVQQVKTAARQVNKGATDSETFARPCLQMRCGRQKSWR